MAGASISEQPRIVRTFSVVGLAAVVVGANDYLIASTGLLLISSQGAGQAAVDWRAVDWALYLKPTFWRLRVQVRTSGPAAPAADCYCTLYSANVSVANAGAITLTAEVPNIRGALTNLALTGTAYELTTPTVPVAADGFYVPVLHSNQAWAATSGAVITGSLEAFSR